MKKILLGLSIILAVVFSGCGGGGGDSSTPPVDEITTITMEVGGTYKLLSGDYITNVKDANLTVETDNNITTAKLNDGNATCSSSNNGCIKQ